MTPEQLFRINKHAHTVLIDSEAVFEQRVQWMQRVSIPVNELQVPYTSSRTMSPHEQIVLETLEVFKTASVEEICAHLGLQKSITLQACRQLAATGYVTWDTQTQTIHTNRNVKQDQVRDCALLLFDGISGEPLPAKIRPALRGQTYTGPGMHGLAVLKEPDTRVIRELTRSTDEARQLYGFPQSARIEPKAHGSTVIWFLELVLAQVHPNETLLLEPKVQYSFEQTHPLTARPEQFGITTHRETQEHLLHEELQALSLADITIEHDTDGCVLLLNAQELRKRTQKDWLWFPRSGIIARFKRR